MTIWHGTAGAIKLERTDGGQRAYERLVPADVRPANDKFSFSSVRSSLVTGDLVWLRRIEEDGSLSLLPLDFVLGWSYPDGQWYARVDRVGGVSLHPTWEDALNGSSPVALATPASEYRLSVDIKSDELRRYLAHVQKYTLRVTRENVDATGVGDSYKHTASTVVGGRGTIDLLWDYGAIMCDDILTETEKAAYLHQLALRQQTGASFKAYLMLKDREQQPLDATMRGEDVNAELYYTFSAVIDEVQTSVDVDDVIRSVVDFTVTGPIELVYESVADLLLLEQGAVSRMLRENNSPTGMDQLL